MINLIHEVLAVLETTQWKSGLKIQNDVFDQFKRNDQFGFRAQLYALLDVLESSNIIEHQDIYWRDCIDYDDQLPVDPEREVRVYRLTAFGQEKREQIKLNEIFATDLFPQSNFTENISSPPR